LKPISFLFELRDAIALVDYTPNILRPTESSFVRLLI
jgi:hypothetical protein